MKHLNCMLLILLAAALSSCATQLNKPLASVLVERTGNNENGKCIVSFSVYNQSDVAWDGVSIYILARNTQSDVVGEWRAIPMRFIDPGKGVQYSLEKPAEAPCSQLDKAVVQYLGVYPTGRGQVRVKDSLVNVSLK